MRGLQVLLLGRARLELDGQALSALVPAKQQALLYVLAAEGQPLPRTRAATLLWGQHDEAAARANLRVALSQLRRWLPGMLAIDKRQLAFADDAPVTVDLAELEAAAAPACDWSPQRRRAAAEAWRGPLLDGFALDDADDFDRWLQPQRQRAAAAALNLRAALAQGCAAAGDLDGAIAHTRARLAIDDADEPAHMDLMRWLAARGQRTAALAQYEACRLALLERLGARPSADCYALYTRIHADAAAPPRAAPAAPAASPQPPHRGPPPPAELTLIGRHAERELLSERLLDPACRWLTLLGPGGMGKTTLAAALAAALAPRFDHGALWLSCRDEGGLPSDPDAVLRRLAEHCGGEPVAAGSLLLVLDNLETVPLPAARELLSQLDRRAGGVTTLATSRQRLGDSREWLFELAGLSLQREQPERPASSAAARMLVDAARRVQPGFDEAAHADTIERVVQRLGGLPLALQLAGRAAPQLGIDALERRLAAGDVAGLDAVFDDAWARLDAACRDAALRLAALPAEADLELAAVAGVGADMLEALRDRSWLARTESARLAMHPLQQQYVRRRAESAAVQPQVTAMLASALADRLPRVGPFGDGPTLDDAARSAAQRLGASALGAGAAIAAAAERWLQHDGIDRLRPRIDGAVALLVACDRVPEAVLLLAQAVGRADLPGWLAAGWRLRRAELQVWLGHSPGTLECFLLPLAQLGAGGIRADVTPQARSFLASAWRLARAQGWPAEPELRRALGRLVQRTASLLGQLISFSPLARGVERCAWLCRMAAGPAGGGAARRAARVMVAYGALFAGHERPARLLMSSVPAPLLLPQDPAHQAHLAVGHAVTLMALGRWTGLSQQLHEAEALYAAVGSRRGVLESRSLRGKLAFYEGRLGDAWRIFGDCDALSRQHPGDAWMAWGLIGQAECAWALGRLDDDGMQLLLQRAAQLLTESANIDNAYTLRRLGLVARLAWRRGDVATARDAVASAVASLAHVPRRGFWAHEGYAGVGEGLLAWAAHERSVGGALPPVQRLWATFELSLRGHGRRFPAGRALVLRLQGERALAEGDRDGARAALRRGLALAEGQGLRVELARCCEALAALDGAADHRGRARLLWHDMAQPSTAV